MTGAIKKYAEDRAGFAFVELMIVIALIGIMSAIAVPSYLRSLPEKRLRSATMNLYADMQKARLLAVKRNTNVFIQFNATEKSYSISIDENKDGNISDDEQRIRTLSDYEEVIYGCTTNEGWYNGQSIPESGVPEDNSFSFTSTGVMDTAMPISIYLRYLNNDTIISYAITLTQFGAVKIRRFDGNIWD